MTFFQTYKHSCKEKIARGILYCFLLLINFFLGGCSTYSEKLDSVVKKEDQIWMENFLQDFFLEGSTLYTLFGTKPISGKIISYGTEEDCKKSVFLYLEREGITGDQREQTLKEALESFQKDPSAKNWDKWTSFMKQFPNSPFLFAKHPTRSKKLWSAHIVNIQETIWTLQKYYDIFKKEVGFDFDPALIIKEFSNLDSPFWKKVFSSSLLSGLVYGYGYKNSYIFGLYIVSSEKEQRENPLFYSLKRFPSPKKSSHSIKGLPLPKFRSFTTPFNEDPILEKYKLERKKIQSRLTKNNFFEEVLYQILGEHPEKSRRNST